ncbi:molybdate ABC transporter substrate-binding protein [Seleniivibrio sp.]|uniref:molybdate ABC transporter substrate-binding protein n=1 Tax=Seleniivibrio sp. TaxID=2898801 RepID=UPI0025E436C4|nr:molybdate ABC transporter substrate-binding protein [Seleniivibrio sp.]MCD8553006.1 molybdate ABC transporter substrate-binding protein [Seleniivibrio sp.]
MKKILLTVLALAILSVSAYADELRIAAGAGYKALVEDMAAYYEAKTGKKMERMYGNMGQVAAQVKLGGGICAVVGEESFLKTSGIPYTSYNPIGKGVLAIIVRKGLTISSPEDLKKPEFAKIAIPDATKAIYGKAGTQLMKNTGMADELEKRLIPGQTVPQAGSYVLSGEADAAFVNITFAVNNKDNLGGYIEVTKGYSPLEIAAATLEGCPVPEDLKTFIGMLGTPDMKKIAKKNGL